MTTTTQPAPCASNASAECRTSGFMLYRSEYAELYFTDIMWPDFNESELDKALTDYANRRRRFGK